MAGPAVPDFGPVRSALAAAGPRGGRATRAYGGRSAEARAADRRQRLLTAAFELIGEYGFAAVSIPQVCARARTSTRFFYEQFTDRDELYRAVYDQVVAGAVARVEEAVAATDGSDVATVLAAAVTAYLRYATGDGRRARILYVEETGQESPMGRHHREVVHAFAAVLADTVRTADLAAGRPARDLLLRGIGVMGAVTELVNAWLAAGPAGFGVDDGVREAVVIARAAVTAD